MSIKDRFKEAAKEIKIPKDLSDIKVPKDIKDINVAELVAGGKLMMSDAVEKSKDALNDLTDRASKFQEETKLQTEIIKVRKQIEKELKAFDDALEPFITDSNKLVSNIAEEMHFYIYHAEQSLNDRDSERFEKYMDELKEMFSERGKRQSENINIAVRKAENLVISAFYSEMKNNYKRVIELDDELRVVVTSRY